MQKVFPSWIAFNAWWRCVISFTASGLGILYEERYSMSKKAIKVLMLPELANALDDQCKKLGITCDQFANEAVNEYLARRKAKKLCNAVYLHFALASISPGDIKRSFPCFLKNQSRWKAFFKECNLYKNGSCVPCKI